MEIAFDDTATAIDDSSSESEASPIALDASTTTIYELAIAFDDTSIARRDASLLMHGAAPFSFRSCSQAQSPSREGAALDKWNRALGGVPINQRKRCRMFKSSKDALNRITAATEAWGTLRPAKSFSGLTLDQFKESIKPVHEVRAEITELQRRLQAAVTRRSVVDGAAIESLRRVILGVKADPEDGEDSELYEAMGYVRRSDRGSGLTRRREKEGVKSQNGAA